MSIARFVRVVRHRLRSLAYGRELDADVQRELAMHFDLLVREKISEGLPVADARREARRALGNPAVLSEQCRDQRRVTWFHDIRRDVEYGIRTLRRTPVFTVVVLSSLALGIGSNTAVLGVMHAVLYEGLPLPDAERLVVIRTVPVDNPGRTAGAALHEYVAWKERNRSFDEMTVSLSGPRDIGADETGRPAERITGQAVAPGYFAMLGAHAVHGRVLNASDDAADSAVVVISNRLWRSRYAADPAIVGQQIRIDGHSRVVVGVIAPEFRYRDPRIDCWLPLHIGSRARAGNGRFFGVTGRLKPGVTRPQAEADLNAITAQLATEFPESSGGIGVRLEPLADALFGWTKEPLATLETAAALVLLIVSANVAGLMLARASIRQREIAVRISIGAGRGRIVRQLLTESLLLALAGGALGLLVPWGGFRGLAALAPPIGSPRIDEIAVSLPTVAFACLLSILTGLAFGVMPALTTSHVNPLVPLTNRSGAATKSFGCPGRSTLVAAQLALALVLMVGSGLLIRSFLRLSERELNFNPANLLMFEVRTSVPQRSLGQLGGMAHVAMDAPPWQTMQHVYERLRTIPGAEAVGGISFAPVDSLILPVMDVVIPERTAGREPGGPRAAYFLVTPSFFAAMQTPLVRGRHIDEQDTAGRPWVAVVNETAARRFWPGTDPIGRRLRLDVVPEELPREVVGVVRDIPVRYSETEAQPVIYASYLQQPLRYRGPWNGMFGQMTFVVRTTGAPLSLVPAARAAVAEIEPNRPVSAIATADQRIEASRVRRRYFAILTGLLAVMAAILAAIGVYGVLAYSVSQRTREIAIRIALGARTREVVLLVCRHMTLVVGLGLIAGSAAALALTDLIAAQLWGIAPKDPATFAGVWALLIGVAFIACYGPTRRAVLVDPSITLRVE